jgi:lipopolysaccharide/colanic/teichoic acid biosynthesis glycosyltransferase
MSLIGPRPERPELVAQLISSLPHYDARHVVLPGLTGWAQIQLGYAGSLRDTVAKLECDLYYIRHRSLALDCLILLRTIPAVLRLGGR